MAQRSTSQSIAPLHLPPRVAASRGTGTLKSLRTALATSVASAALMAYGSRPVRASPPAGCTANPARTIMTCTGDQSAGVTLNNAGGTYTVLEINNLTTNIAPAAGVTGATFTSNGAITLNANPGPFAIIVTDAEGIFAAANTGTVTINSTADITASGSGATAIQASGQDDLVTITSSGTITTTGNNGFGIAAGTVYGAATVSRRATSRPPARLPPASTSAQSGSRAPGTPRSPSSRPATSRRQAVRPSVSTPQASTRQSTSRPWARSPWLALRRSASAPRPAAT